MFGAAEMKTSFAAFAVSFFVALPLLLRLLLCGWARGLTLGELQLKVGLGLLVELELGADVVFPLADNRLDGRDLLSGLEQQPSLVVELSFGLDHVLGGHL